MGASRGEHEGFFGGSLVDGLPSIVAAAHELKSPLALIRQLSLMLEDNEVSETEYKYILRQISLTSERALRLTSDLTRSVRLSDAMFALEPINPHQLCEDVVHELRPLFLAHGRNVELVSQKHPLLLVANRDLLRRIIINFGDNALHYADKNTSVEISITKLKAGNIVRLSVRDYGPILPGGLVKILGKKIDNLPVTISTRPQSSGLGIHIASQFADVMNGKIGAIRHRNGATFYVDLQASRQLSLL